MSSPLPFFPDAVLFDLDGTLLDTAPDLIGALDHVLHINGFGPCNADLARDYASHGAMGLLKFGFGDSLHAFDVETLRQAFLEYYHDNIAVHTRLFDGVADFLSELDNAQIPWGVVTNKPIGLTEKLMPSFDEFKDCRIIIGGDSLEQRKPHPAPLVHAAQKIGVGPEGCWYLGDAERDIMAANSAGMLSIIAHWGYIGVHDDPDMWNADLAVEVLGDLSIFINRY